jgi:hypothetical protein
VDDLQRNDLVEVREPSPQVKPWHGRVASIKPIRRGKDVDYFVWLARDIDADGYAEVGVPLDWVRKVEDDDGALAPLIPLRRRG